MATPKTEADLEFKRRILASAPVFHSTSEEDLAELARCGKLIAVQRGKPLNKAGQDLVFIVQSGVVVSLQSDHAKTKPVLSAIYGPGDMCGMQHAMTRGAEIQEATPSFLSCLSNVSAIAIPTSDLLRVARREPELSQALMTCLSHQLSKMARLLAQSLHRPLELRLASLFSVIGDLIAGDDWRPTVEIGRISQSFAAEMLGVSREHVNRTLTMWEKSGLIFQNKSSEILIQNRKRLATLAHDKFAAPQAVRDGDWLWEIDSYLDYGLNQTAFHLAMEASRRAPRDMRFRHRAVLATARSGAQAEALALIDKLGLKHDYSDEELACLRPRILRDMAFSSDDEQKRLEYLTDSAEEYAKTFEKCRLAYSGVNAANSYAMLRDTERARGLAGVVSDIAVQELERLDEEDDSYWLRTTVAECKLIQGDAQSAALLFQNASRASDTTPGKKATTRKQLRRLAPFVDIDADWIEKSVPQSKVMFFSGPLAGKSLGETDDLIEKVVDDVEDFLDKTDVGWACGALASGCDIAIAEALLEAGVRLNVYLPLAPNDFLRSSVAAFGEDWRRRFVECMKGAASIEWNRRAPNAVGAAYRLGAMAAMGKTIRHAEELQTDPVGFFAAQQGEDSERSLSIANLEMWRKRGLESVESRAQWPQKERGDGEETTRLKFALSTQVVDDSAQPPSSAPGAEATIEMADVHCSVHLYSSVAKALSASEALTADAEELRLWLDAGVFPTNADEQSAESAAANLITASCRPLTEAGKIFASDIFASAAATCPETIQRFEYAGFANAQEKLDPCPLYFVR